MKFRSQVIEACLRDAAARWRWLRFTETVFKLAIAVCLSLLLVGLAIISGWLTNRIAATLTFVLIGLAAFALFVILAIRVFNSSLKADWLASAIEQVNPGLLDRLNTLVFLELAPRRTRPAGFVKRIARQAQNILADLPSSRPFPALGVLAHFLVFLPVFAGTFWFYQSFSPWEKLKKAELAELTQPTETQKAPEPALTATNNVEQQQAWGEVRITDPGTDLKVTKVDVVPLQIEAAANEALRNVTWQSAVNGGNEQTNELPPPAEPRYAVYQPTVYLNEMGLSDWDVVTYYAKAGTETQKTYASQLYFLEVIPFREDLLKMPGGEEGKAYQYLNELTALIEQQQHVMRETHRAVQNPQPKANLREQDLNKLAAAETDLSEGSRHLNARLAAEMEDKQVGEALDNLAQAEKSLAKSGQLLIDDAMTEAQNRERQALAELASTRKLIQKAISENPQNFDGPKSEEMPAVVGDAQKLKKMAEFRNESKAAQEFVKTTLEKQENLATRASYSQPVEFPKLAAEEELLQQSLQDFRQQHPQAFNRTEAETHQAQEAMKNAAKSLEKHNPQSRSTPKEAANQLQKLDEAMRNRSGERQLADAYKLKQLLDRQIRTFGQCEQSGGKMGDTELQGAATAAKETIDALEKLASQPPTSDAFGQSLRDALAPEKKAAMEDQLERLSQKQDEGNKQMMAGEAKRLLSPVSKAFDESQPQSAQNARKQDSLKPSSQECLALGLAELESLATRLENKRKVPSQDQARQGREALLNLQQAVRELYGNNERAMKLLQQLDKELKPREQPMDIEALKRLAAELQRFSIETADAAAKKDRPAEVTNIDPSRLPPAYRGRIENYFKKLSEK